MTSRFKVFTTYFGAFLATGTLVAGVAQAKPTIQPQFTRNGETIKANHTIEEHSRRTRFWNTGTF